MGPCWVVFQWRKRLKGLVLPPFCAKMVYPFYWCRRSGIRD